jgi:pyruvate/2-oxoglutarate dehydrogenase complex dihydrolipoamide dehydrogenase (E3) component
MNFSEISPHGYIEESWWARGVCLGVGCIVKKAVVKVGGK